jgi:hypothetical protein
MAGVLAMALRRAGRRRPPAGRPPHPQLRAPGPALRPGGRPPPRAAHPRPGGDPPPPAGGGHAGPGPPGPGGWAAGEAGDSDPEVARLLAVLANAGPAGLTVPELVGATGRQKTWVYDRLADLQQTGPGHRGARPVPARPASRRVAGERCRESTRPPSFRGPPRRARAAIGAQGASESAEFRGKTTAPASAPLRCRRHWPPRQGGSWLART